MGQMVLPVPCAPRFDVRLAEASRFQVESRRPVRLRSSLVVTFVEMKPEVEFGVGIHVAAHPVNEVAEGSWIGVREVEEISSLGTLGPIQNDSTYESRISEVASAKILARDRISMISSRRRHCVSLGIPAKLCGPVLSAMSSIC